MRLLKQVLAVVVTGVVLCGGTAAHAAAAPAVTGQEVKRSNPHLPDADCSVCHTASAETLAGWFVLGSTKRQLVEEPDKLCQKCHGLGFGHGVGKRPSLNRADLPLTPAGTITCAYTCHNMHLKKAEDAVQRRYMLRRPITGLCESCHNN